MTYHCKYIRKFRDNLILYYPFNRLDWNNVPHKYPVYDAGQIFLLPSKIYIESLSSVSFIFFAESILCCLLDDEEEMCNNKLTNLLTKKNKLTNLEVSYFVIPSTESEELTKLKNKFTVFIVFILRCENVSLESLAKITKKNSIGNCTILIVCSGSRIHWSLNNGTVVWWKW